MPTTAQSSLSPILASVRAQLSALTGLPANLILYVARGWDRVPHMQGDQDILLRVAGLTPDSGFEQGSGRYATVVERPLLVVPRTRLSLDPADRDESWLTDPSLGQFALEDAIFNALQDWSPIDSQNNWLTAEVLRLMPFPEADKESAGSVQFGHTPMAFQLRYVLTLDPSLF